MEHPQLHLVNTQHADTVQDIVVRMSQKGGGTGMTSECIVIPRDSGTHTGF